MGNSSSSISPTEEEIKKIHFAMYASDRLVTNVMGSRDSFSLATFSEAYRLRQGFTSSAFTMHNEIGQMINYVNGGTALYDALLFAAVHFIQNANRSRPWIMIAITDGSDTTSKTSLEECADTLANFTKIDSNHIFLVGVGNDVNNNALRNLAKRGGMLYVHIQDIRLLELLFALIAVQIVTSRQIDIQGILSRGDNVDAVWARVREQQSLARQPMDVMLLVDTSGSMSDAVA